LMELGICLAAAAVVGVVVELEKAWRRRTSQVPAVLP
jgi:P-type Ca2+ transporter type 2C